ncbi:MAG: hypothetical protein DMG50_28645 [Acidobacteria bacterium]|nr:MAG: hypothetical protein DMG50_28645 [Acidobacteriota bacterium]
MQESSSPIIRAAYVTSAGLPCHVDGAVRPIYSDRGFRRVALAARRNLLPKAGKVRGERYAGPKELICGVGEKEQRRNSDGQGNKTHEVAGPRSNLRHDTLLPIKGWAGPKSLFASYSLHGKLLFVCGVTSWA